MRLLLDENLGESVRRALDGFGHDLATVQPRGGRATSDSALVAEARAEGRVLVTLDEGFADTVRFDPVETAGIVLINLPDERQPDIGVPVERLQRQSVDVRRAVADLATERKLLEDQAEKVEEQCARLKELATEALSAGRGEEAHDLIAESRDSAVRLAEVRKRRDAVRLEEERIGALVDSLAIRAREVAVEHLISRAQTLIDSVAVPSEDSTLAPELATDRRAEAYVATSSVSPEDLQRQYEDDAAFKAVHDEASIRARLVGVWGSLARELAVALRRLMTALEDSDPTGRLWLIGVDDVREYHDAGRAQ